MEKTIKQIAEELNISKQAVRKRINQLPTNCYHSGINRTILINEEGQRLLGLEVSTKCQPKVDTKVYTEVDTLLDILNKQLQIKDEQLKVKDKQIEELHQLLDQSQKLQAISEQKIKALEEKQNEELASEEVQVKVKWWQKLFSLYQ